MIILNPYNSNWKSLFEIECQSLLSLGEAWIKKIEHIGSTAIEGIYAKPIIDIMIGVNQLYDADRELILPIQSLNYEYISIYEEMFPLRRFFQKHGNDGVRTHHIHLVEINSDFWVKHLLFRDYLRANPVIAHQYEELKLTLAPKFNDGNQYAAAKTEFINHIITDALNSKYNY